jgi:hypothetical protein
MVAADTAAYEPMYRRCPVQLLIKEWVNRTATVMTENGQVLWTFSSLAAARAACREWQALSGDEPVTCLEESVPACAAGWQRCPPPQ